MKKTLFFLLVFSGVASITYAQQQNLESQLFDLPNVQFKEIETSKGYKKTYELHIKQVVDHSDSSKGYFYQKAYLSHKGFDRPTVIITEGYDMKRPRNYELAELIDANQLEVEHRYFGESVPDSMDYTYLNLKQETADLHYINQLFRKIYNGKWVSTGISKGGSTTIFYRYFYPEDVDVSVPYVAPLNNAFEDKRIYSFLDTIGSDECHDKVEAIQKRLLTHRDEVLPRLKYYAKGAGLEFTYLSFERAFEYAVLEYPFSFWQFGYNCNKIPNETTPLDSVVDYFIKAVNMSFFSDKEIAMYGSHYYQAATEMGYYGYETKDFKDLLKALPTNTNPHATFLPNKMKVPFDGTLLKNVGKWIKDNGNQFIYIYGGIDTWSATAVPPSKNVDAVWFMLKGKHHGSARISNMNEEEKQKLIETLEKWLAIDIKNTLPSKE